MNIYLLKALFLFSLVLVSNCVGAQTTDPFVDVVFPNSANTWLMAINDANATVGYYEESAGGSKSGFLMSKFYTLAINYPGATNTYCTGINNDGVIVGNYDFGDPAAGGGFKFSPPYNLEDYENITDILGGVTFIRAEDINDLGCYAGDFKQSTLRKLWFKCPGDVNVSNYNPDVLPTFGKGINLAGNISGYQIDGGVTKGLIWYSPNFSALKQFNNGNKTRFLGNNDNGKYVGDYNNLLSLVYDDNTDVFTTISIQNAVEHHAEDVNNNNIIVGYYTNAAGNTKGYMLITHIENGLTPIVNGWGFSNTEENLWPAAAYAEIDNTYDPYLLQEYGVQTEFTRFGINDEVIPGRAYPSWLTWVEAFGENKVYITNNGNKKRRKRHTELWQEALIYPFQGACFGMSLSGLIQHDSLTLFVNRFPNNSNLGTIPYSNTDASEFRNVINALQLYQRGANQLRDKATRAEETPFETAQRVIHSFLFSQNNNPMLSIENQVDEDNRHAIYPYKVDISNIEDVLKYSIGIYDCNYPGALNKVIEIYKPATGNSTWSYEVNPGEFYAIDKEKHCFVSGYSKTRFEQPIAVGYSSISTQANVNEPIGRSVETGVLLFSPTNNSFIINTSNDTLGRVNDVIVKNQIDASELRLETTVRSKEIGYLIPIGQQQNINIINSDSAQTTVLFLDDNAQQTYILKKNNNTNSKNCIAKYDQGLYYINEGNNTDTISFIAINELDGDIEQSFEISNIVVAPNQSIGISFNGEGNLYLNNPGTVANYDVLIEVVSPDNLGIFTHPAITISENTDHLIVPFWNDLGAGQNLFIVDNGSNGSIEDTLFFEDIPLNIGVIESNKLHIFPNPTTDILYITAENNAKISQIEVIDLCGKTIQLQSNPNNFNSPNANINISHLSKGVYWLKCSTSKGIRISKFIKS
jgi:hypothetical protein